MVVAHAGDGNFHTLIMFDPSQEEQRREAERLNHFMVHTALSMEGNNLEWMCIDLYMYSRLPIYEKIHALPIKERVIYR